ncbi:MAG: helix-turn-helix transcriptional regulator [Lachnospiraceae bacterium]|jgi:transcriptional regulator with XRE-family HTH domain|nr:helix-turn-helix transcriptional regulator [Lachnospiraceae bacterium]
MTFSEKLLLIRKQKGLSQEQLAEMLDVSRQSVSKWETQQTLPEPNKLVLIRIFLMCPSTSY